MLSVRGEKRVKGGWVEMPFAEWEILGGLPGNTSRGMELRLPLEMSPGREAACRAVFGTWGFFRTMHGKTAPSC